MPAVIAPSAAQPVFSALPTIADTQKVQPMNYTMTGFINKESVEEKEQAPLSDNDAAIARPSAADMVVDIEPIEQSQAGTMDEAPLREGLASTGNTATIKQTITSKIDEAEPV